MKFLWIDPERRYGRRDLEGDYDGVIIGGSSGFDLEEINSLIEMCRELGLKVYLFPNNSSLISSRVDAVLFMQLMNSSSVYWSSEVLALGAPVIKALGIKVIPTALLIFDPGRMASFIADVKPIPVDDPRLARMHALAGEYLGAKLIFLERAGGVPENIVRAVREEVDIRIAAVGGKEIEDLVDMLVMRK